jgi:hypothetical protein
MYTSLVLVLVCNPIRAAIMYVVVYIYAARQLRVLTHGQQNRRISAQHPSRSLVNLQTYRSLIMCVEPPNKPNL